VQIGRGGIGFFDVVRIGPIVWANIEKTQKTVAHLKDGWA